MYIVFSVTTLNQIIAADRELEREIQRVRIVHSNNSRSDRTRDRTRDRNTDINNNNTREPDRNSTNTNHR